MRSAIVVRVLPVVKTSSSFKITGIGLDSVRPPLPSRHLSSIFGLNSPNSPYQAPAGQKGTDLIIIMPQTCQGTSLCVVQAKMDVSKLDKLEGWNELWSGDFAPWHIADVNPKLAAHLSTVFAASGKADPEFIRFFVPLCGKSVDLKFLYDRGFQVIGCEGSEKACQEFFVENKIEFKKSEESGFSLFENSDGRLKIFCGDFFNLTSEILGGPVDCVWDRGSFVAIDVSQREKYGGTISSLLSENFGYLLVSIERQIEPPNMMPHSVSFADVIQFFGQFCSVKVLDQLDTPGTEQSGIIKDNAFLMSRKQVSENEIDRLNYWQARWAKGDSQWHSDKPNEILVRHLDGLKAGREHVRIFLPLCGKSLDLVWLYNQGHTVVGLEGTPFVAEQVFQNANLEYKKLYLTEIDGFAFKTPDDRLTVYSCDFFKMKPEIIGKFEAVFDRGAFEAINESDREAYADLVLQCLSPMFRYVLNGYEYPAGEFRGPPRNVAREEVYKLFERNDPDGFCSKVSILEELDYSEHGRTKFNLEVMNKLIYMIKNSE